MIGKMTYINEMKIQFLNKSVNEGLARVAVASFCAQLDLTVEVIADIKTAVSEAVTNAIVHGYENMCGFVTVCCAYTMTEVEITVSDYGFTRNSYLIYHKDKIFNSVKKEIFDFSYDNFKTVK